MNAAEANVLTMLNAALAAPKTHAVITTYASGAAKRHETRSAKTAEMFAIGERRKIGRNLIDRETGATVRVVSVEIVAL